MNATFDGKFSPSPFNLPTGPLRAGAAIHVFDAQAFGARLATAGNATAQFLLGSYPLTAALDPVNAFNNLRGQFPQGILATGQTVLTTTAAPVIATVSTSLVTVAPQQKFTVMYDVSTSSASQTVGDRTGGGTVNFLNTLAPAPVQFTGLAGEAVTGLVPSDSTPPPPPAPTSVALSPAYSTHPAGGTASIAAVVSAGASTPLSELPVEFVVTAGPNAGKSGVAVTDDTGRATFTYVGDRDVGKDVIQANVAQLTSNMVEHVWSAAKCPQNQLFWLRYPGLWPAQTLSIGGADYDQQTTLKLLKLAPLNPSLALWQQVAIVKLNTAYGGDTSRLTLAVLNADDLLKGFNRSQPYQNQVNLKTSIDMVTLAAKMAVYNSGVSAQTCR